jgi:1-deoxy-D-xylulose-5-phosphate reductoisomerase
MRQRGCLEPLDFRKISQLTFEEPDFERFPCLSLAYKAINIGGTMPAVLNAANEIAVQAFLDGKIGLSEISQINEFVMNEHESQAAASLEIVLQADNWSRRQAETIVSAKSTSAIPAN